MEHGFRKLKKEQNKLISKAHCNMMYPIKFNINHIYKLYKHALMKRSLKKIRDINGNLDDTDVKEDLKDILEDNYF